MTDKPRPNPGENPKDDLNLGQKEAEREKAELAEEGDRDDDPNLGQKEAEEERAELEEGEDRKRSRA